MTTKIPSPKKDKAGRTTFTVTFTKEQIVPAEEGALKKIGSSVKIEGFRPGKVPTEMLREKVSPDQLLEETIRALLPDTIKKLTEENEIKPIIPPKVEAQDRDPLTLDITFVEHPQVTVKGVDKLKIEKEKPKVDAKDVERMIDYILEQHQKATEVDRAAKNGDRVTMNFVGKDKEGKEVEGTKTEGHSVALGSKTLIPGFEEELVGLKKGEDKSFTLTFPKEYHAEHLQGKPVTFDVTVIKIEELEKPKLTDKFAKEQLGAKSLDDFKKRVRESLEEQEERVSRKRQEGKLMEMIRSATSVELAPELLEEEERGLFESFAKQLQERNIDFSDWLKQMGKKPEDVKEDMKKQARDRLTLRLGIQHVVEEKDIDIKDQEMEDAIKAFLAPLSDEERTKIEPMYQKGYQGWEQLKWQKKVEKLIDMMLE